MGKDFLSIRLITPQDNNNKDMLKMREYWITSYFKGFTGHRDIHHLTIPLQSHHWSCPLGVIHLDTGFMP